MKEYLTLHHFTFAICLKLRQRVLSPELLWVPTTVSVLLSNQVRLKADSLQ
jgi:hypothetical protein